MKTGKPLTKQQCREIAKETFLWCINKFGNPLKTLEPSLKVSFNKSNKYNYGLYYNRVISVFPLVCETERLIIRTVIHEYRHFLQMPKMSNMSQYSKLCEEFDYENHPLEIDAREFEKLHYPKCRAYLKRKGVI
jgi:hypothetical protein